MKHLFSNHELTFGLFVSHGKTTFFTVLIIYIILFLLLDLKYSESKNLLIQFFTLFHKLLNCHNSVKEGTFHMGGTQQISRLLIRSN